MYNRYTHTVIGDEATALERLPNLSLQPDSENPRAKGICGEVSTAVAPSHSAEIVDLAADNCGQPRTK